MAAFADLWRSIAGLTGPVQVDRAAKIVTGSGNDTVDLTGSNVQLFSLDAGLGDDQARFDHSEAPGMVVKMNRGADVLDVFIDGYPPAPEWLTAWLLDGGPHTATAGDRLNMLFVNDNLPEGPFRVLHWERFGPAT